MNYSRVRKILATHQPYDNKEQADMEHISFLLEQHDKLLGENCSFAHITGSAIVTAATSKQVLLVFHRKLKKWVQPGGHGANELDPAQTALREAFEETGLDDLYFFPPTNAPYPIDIDVHLIPPHGDKPAHEHLDFRYLLITHTPEALHPAVTEIDNARWLTIETAIKLTPDIALQRLLTKVAIVCQQI